MKQQSHHQIESEIDVLLVYPIWITSGGWGKIQRMLPPLGILSLASFLEANNYKVKVLDLHTSPLSPDAYKKMLIELKPKVIGISLLSCHFEVSHHIASISADVLPDVKIIAGGVHAEIDPEGMLQNPCIDAVCRGDGEETLLEYVKGVPVSEILGLSYRTNDSKAVIHNAPRMLNKDLDSYPFPAYHLLDLKKYSPPAGTYRKLPAINIMMTRGCYGKCDFCNSANVYTRHRSVNRVIELIKHLRDQYGIRQIYFYDDTFTASKQVVIDFCNQMIEQNIDVHWVCYVRVDSFNEEIAALMSKAKCNQILIGVESADSKIMESIGKKISKELYQRVVKLAHDYGIEVRGSFVFGHELETEESMRKSLKFAMDLNLDFYQPNIYTPYPGTRSYRELSRRNLIAHHDFSYYGQGCSLVKLQNLSGKKVVDFVNSSVFKFYFRPKMIFKQLLRLRVLAHFIDSCKVLYLLLWKGLVNSKVDTEVEQWTKFDLKKTCSLKIIKLKEVRLTYEARQNEVF